MHKRRKRMFRSTIGLCLAVGLGWAGVTYLPSAGASTTAPAAPGVKGKVYAGYQGWFAAPGDGSPLGGWAHWASGTPSPGHQTFEVYPDMSAYPAAPQFQTGYAPLGNGKPATLFSSYSASVVDQQFKWMQQYGIDGAAIQRVGNDIVSPGSARNVWRNTITTEAVTAAEKYGRGFHIDYDISGLSDANFEQVVKTDWTETVTKSLHLTDSPMYARENGKPVVEIWGLGYTNRPGTVEGGTDLINWFKNQGIYVIGGVPRGWHTDYDAKPGFAPVYRAFDMISPWMVGGATNNASEIADDLAALKPTGQDYQPVIYPGFSWSNWKSGPRNQIPRRNGDFFWEQALNVHNAGVKQAFIAMFDEYDEGTAIAPAASDSSEIPSDQYFQTTSADGKYVSSDFYLRLAGKATRMIDGLDPASPTVPIPLSAGPVFFRTGLEQDTDAQPTWTSTPIPGGTKNVTSPTLAVATGADRQSGQSALEAKGGTPTTTHSYAYLQAFDVDIPVSAQSKLTYGFLPKDTGGRDVSVDLIMSDGSTLRDSAATTTTGIDMHPGAPKGTVGQWSTIQSDIGTWLNGKRISKIVVGYDRTGVTDMYDAFVDNISVTG